MKKFEVWYYCEEYLVWSHVGNFETKAEAVAYAMEHGVTKCVIKERRD